MTVVIKDFATDSFGLFDLCIETSGLAVKLIVADDLDIVKIIDDICKKQKNYNRNKMHPEYCGSMLFHTLY